MNPLRILSCPEAREGAGEQAGIALQPDTPIAVVEPLVDQVDVVLILGTKIGVKGQEMIPKPTVGFGSCVGSEGENREEVEIMADGAIRTHTVEKLVEAGADILVPGSLVFGNNIAETINWLHSLTR